MSNATKDVTVMGAVVKTAYFAARKHKDQRRKDFDQTPFINPLGVANILIEEGGVDDLEVIQAAILHDTVEDTDTSFEELEETFGKEVASLVREVTVDKRPTKEERKQLEMNSAPKKSPRAKLISMADKIYNLRDLNRVTPEGWTEERKHEYFVWAEKCCVHFYESHEEMAGVLRGLFDNHFNGR